MQTLRVKIDDFVTEAVALMHRRCDLVAAYVIGSVATGDLAGTASDVDLLLVTHRRLADCRRLAAGEELADLAMTAPLRGVEAVLYRADVLAQPRHPLAYDLNVNAGREMERVISTSGDEPFWFLLDVAAARQHATPVLGPPAADVIGEVRAADVRAALGESLHWQRRHGKADADSVLNICRGLHWLRTGDWVSKTAAGEAYIGARASAAISAALSLRRSGSDGPVDPDQVAELRTDLETALRDATS